MIFFLNFSAALHAVPVCTMWPIRAADSAVGTKEKCIIQHYVCSVLMNCISGSAAMDTCMTEPDLPTTKPGLLTFPQGNAEKFEWEQLQE